MSATPESKTVLATGAIAGIVVGAVIFLVIVIAALWFWLRYKKKKSERASNETSAIYTSKGEYANPGDAQYHRYEVDARSKANETMPEKPMLMDESHAHRHELGS